MRNAHRFLLLAFVLSALMAGCTTNVFESTPVPPTPGPAPTPTTTAIPLTPVDKLGLTGTPVEVDIAAYRLVVDGLVERPLALSYDELLAYPTVSWVLRLECPGFFVDWAEWTGPLLRTVLEEARVRPEASTVKFYDGDEYPYTRTLPLEQALRDDTILVHRVNGVTLPVEHGYPVRMAIGSELGDYWVKWLFRIEVQ